MRITTDDELLALLGEAVTFQRNGHPLWEVPVVGADRLGRSAPEGCKSFFIVTQDSDGTIHLHPVEDGVYDEVPEGFFQVAR